MNCFIAAGVVILTSVRLVTTFSGMGMLFLLFIAYVVLLLGVAVGTGVSGESPVCVVIWLSDAVVWSVWAK